MTRINVIPVKELCNKHLFAEWREMPRLIKNLQTSLNRKNKPFDLLEIPPKYVLGKGHVKFFYNKFLYLHNRYIEITQELLHRGYGIGTYDASIFASVGKKWYNDYNPTQEAIELNRKRIKDRLPANPKWRV